MQVWSLTDPGCVRTENQDALEVLNLKRKGMLCVVCDGMGGAKAGDVASSMAAREFAQEISDKLRLSMSKEALDDLLEQAVARANLAVYNQAKESSQFSGMGTTLVAVLLRGKLATVVNVGDSRVYRVNEDSITQITVDHSLVQLMIQRGDLSQEQASHFPGKNLITRAIGTESSVKGDLFHVDVKRGDHLLLCTEGLTNLVHDQEIMYEILHGTNKAECCQRLLDIAKKRGAPDNVTSILVQI